MIKESIPETITHSGSAPEIIASFQQHPILRFRTREDFLRAIWTIVDWVVKGDEITSTFYIHPGNQLQPTIEEFSFLLNHRRIPYQKVDQPKRIMVFESYQESLDHSLQNYPVERLLSKQLVCLRLADRNQFIKLLDVTEQHQTVIGFHPLDLPVIEVEPELIASLNQKGIEYRLLRRNESMTKDQIEQIGWEFTRGLRSTIVKLYRLDPNFNESDYIFIL